MGNVELISGGVTTPKGFLASGIHCGLRKNREKKDLALIFTKSEAKASAVYTQNLVKGAPCIVTKEHLKNGVVKAVICNSGVANTCAADGIEKAKKMAEITAKALGIDATEVVVASTGVIGPSLNVKPIETAMPHLVLALSSEGGTEAAKAIMTTDTVEKERAVSFSVGGISCKIGGMVKGSGMIAPNMATMLGFLTSDVKISNELLEKALKNVIKKTFNMLSIDGDTSTNDMLTILANGESGCKEINNVGEEYNIFASSLEKLCTALVKDLARDGEGATKLIECHVSGGKTQRDADKVVKAVIKSSLVKTAIFGSDANWGRVLCAIGNSGASVDVEAVDISFVSKAGQVKVCKKGAEIFFDEDFAKTILKENEIIIQIRLSDGDFKSTAWGCDLTYDYVKINGDYRT